MADEDPKEPKLSPRPVGSRVTAQLYEQMWEVYRDGERTIQELADKTGVHYDTAKRAINDGWPDREMQPLRQRAREHDRIKSEAERAAAIHKHKEATDAWYRAGVQFNGLADRAVTFCMLSLQQIANLAVRTGPDGRQMLRPLTKWVKRRSVEVDEQGKRTVRYYDEEVPLTTKEAVQLEAQVLKAAAMASAFKKLWPVTTDEQKAETGPPQGLAALTMEELDYINTHGQLPPGKTAEEVFGYEVPGFPSKKSGRGSN